MRVASSWRLPSILAVLTIAACPHLAHAGVQCGEPNQSGASACFIDPTIDPSALCNDGSIPAFWIRPGTGAGQSRWVVWLEGGGQCIDKKSCTERVLDNGSAKFTTSAGFTPGVGDGVLSPVAAVNPILYSANTVLVHYCSSDFWSGAFSSNRTFDGSDPTTWNFQGRRIAIAAIMSVQKLVPSFTKAKAILLGGSSAGAIGITVTANDILPVLPASADIRLANDAGFTLNLGQYDPDAASPYIYPGNPNAFETTFQDGMNLWHGRGDAKCDEAAQTGRERLDCYNTSLVLQAGYIDLPTFVAESQIDLAQVSDQLCPKLYGNCPVSHDPNGHKGQYATAFGKRMAKLLVGNDASTYFVYSPDAYMHVILTSQSVFSTKYQFPGKKLSARDDFEVWLRGGNGRIVDIGNKPGVSAIKP